MGGLCFALGKIIRIKKDGQTTTVEVPNGSDARIGSGGEVDVTLPGQGEPGNVNPAAELKALQGKWTVLRVEKGNDADSMECFGYGPGIDPASLYRIEFMGADQGWGDGKPILATFLDPRVFSPNRGGYDGPSLTYRIDPSAAPKTMDVYNITYVDHSPKEYLKARAIYEIQGDQLRIAITRYLTAVTVEQRPKDFAVKPDSATVVLTLRRYSPTVDDTAVQWKWRVAAEIDNGVAIAAEKLQGRSYLFDDYSVTITGDKSEPHVSGRWVLETTEKPKGISILYYEWIKAGDGKTVPKNVDLLGIYKFDNDRFTIAYRQDGPRPEKFESAFGSGVTLLVLEKASSESTSRSAKAQPETPSSPKSPLPTVRVTQPVVCDVCDYEEYTGRIVGDAVQQIMPPKKQEVH